jgi:hypothetical protein
MAIRVLIINRQLAFSVALKQALERTGGFDAHPFTTADAAIEYLQTHPQDVALIDFNSVAPSGASVVDTLRRIQPGLAIIASPRQTQEVTGRLQLQESLDPPFSARDVIPLLNRAVDASRRSAGGALPTPVDQTRTQETRLKPPAPAAPPAPQISTDALKQQEAKPSTLRPGEIGAEQLRPYMYSSDLFRQRTEDLSPPPLTTGIMHEGDGDKGLRPGEIDAAQLSAYQNRTDAPDVQRRPGEYRTEDLQPPSTDVMYGEGEQQSYIPPLERPDRRRTGPMPTDDVPAAPSLRPGEFSEQDLLNLALNQGGLTDIVAPPPTTPSQRAGEISDDEAAQYRISTDIFKENDPGESALSAEDAYAMWEQLTRENTPSEPMPAVNYDEPPAPAITDNQEFAFDEFRFPDEGDTPEQGNSAYYDDVEDMPLPSPEEQLPSMTDYLIARAQQVEATFEEAVEDTLEEKPVSATDLLIARAKEYQDEVQDEPDDLPITTDWGFRGTGALQEDEAPPRDPDMVARSRKTTNPLGGSVLPDPDMMDDFLEQQLQVEALTTDDLPPAPVSITDEVAAVYTMPFNEQDAAVPLTEGLPVPPDVLEEEDAWLSKPEDVDVFQPPAVTAEFVSSWGGTWAGDAPATQGFPQTAPHQVVDEWAFDEGVQRLEQIADEIRRTRETDKLKLSEAVPPFTADAGDVFERLAAEEPPMPDVLEDAGTVGDLRAVVQEPEFQNVLHILRGEPVPPEVPKRKASKPAADSGTITQSEIEEIFTSFSRAQPARADVDDFTFPDEDSDSHPAQMILETALDESTPADSFSLQSLITSIERQLEQHKPNIRPLPSWEQASLRDDLYVREPEFLQQVIEDVEALPPLEEGDAFGDATTFGGQLDVTPDSETEWLPAVTTRPSRLPEQADEWSLLREPEVSEEDTTGFTKPFDGVSADEVERLPQLAGQEPEFNTEFERLAAFELPEEDAAEFTPSMGMPPIQDPVIAQIALSLTQVSLEEVAAAVLIRENGIIAFAGRLGRGDIEEVGAAIGGQWESDSDQANVRFVTVPSSGKDYMLYTRATVNELTLALVFAGSTPLRDIRRQGKRLLEALTRVPEPVTESAQTALAPVPLASDVRNKYTYVWLLRDPNQRLSDMVARAIETGMSVQLMERAWDVLDVQVRDDFVYLHADVPGEAPPFEVVRDLQKRAAEIARKQNPALGKGNLWSDGYLIVSPGRALDDGEIMQYIQFERMV